jgi:hypothetical protein
MKPCLENPIFCICIALILLIVIPRIVRITVSQTQTTSQTKISIVQKVIKYVTITLSIAIPATLVFKLGMELNITGMLKSLFDSCAEYELKSDKGTKPQPPDPSTFFYDTDRTNDLYIKGTLSVGELARLDAILEHEKASGGLRLSHQDLGSLSDNNYALMDAYARWRKCKDLMRTTTHVVYPSERKYVH